MTEGKIKNPEPQQSNTRDAMMKWRVSFFEAVCFNVCLKNDSEIRELILSETQMKCLSVNQSLARFEKKTIKKTIKPLSPFNQVFYLNQNLRNL